VKTLFTNGTQTPFSLPLSFGALGDTQNSFLEGGVVDENGTMYVSGSTRYDFDTGTLVLSPFFEKEILVSNHNH